MSEERKKFTLYLHPDNEADQQAIDVIESVNRMGRGELFRNVFVAGLALQQLDSRLPALISTLFTEKLTAEQLVSLLTQTTGWKPSQADIRSVLAELGAEQRVNITEVDKDSEDEQALKAVRTKMAGLM